MDDASERLMLLNEGILFAETIGAEKCQMDTVDARFLWNMATRANPSQQWQPIETAPDYDRVLVAGWVPATNTVAGYWWWYEDGCCGGMAMTHHYATHWCPIVLPKFPEPPKE